MNKVFQNKPDKAIMTYIQMHRNCIQAELFLSQEDAQRNPAYSTNQCQRVFMLPQRTDPKEGCHLEPCRKIVALCQQWTNQTQNHLNGAAASFEMSYLHPGFKRQHN